MTARGVQYGVSRLYAQELRFPGLDHVRALLAVPGSYPGPYAATPAQQAAFERAVEMSPDGMTLTFHLRRPAPDFDQVAALPAFGPVPPAVTLETATTPGPLPQAPTEISRDSGQALVLVPNLAWSPETDALRRGEAGAPVVVVFGDTASPPHR